MIIKTTSAKSQIYFILLLVLVLFSLYFGTIRYGLVNFDDNQLISEQYSFLSNKANIIQAFTQDVFKGNNIFHEHKSYYRPILTISFIADVLLFKNNYKIFHVTNICYHCIASVLLFLFLIRNNIYPRYSFLLTLIFAVHPILNQAVAWIPGRNDILLAIFVLASFISIDMYLKSKRIVSLFFHILFVALALFTKENAMFIFPLLCIYIYVRRQSITIKNSFYYVLGLLYFTITVLWFILRQKALEGSVDSISIPFMVSNFIKNFPFIFQYIGKIMFPYNLSVMCTVKDTNYFIAIIIIILFLYILYRAKAQNKKYMLGGILWFFLFLLPSLIAPEYGGMEHRVYLPLIGIVFIAGILLSYDFSKQIARYISVCLIPIIVLFYYLSYIRLPIFSSSKDFWGSAIETSNYSSKGFLYQGKNFENEGDYKKAISLYEMGIERDSTERMLFNNAGSAYLAIGNYDKAEYYLQKEIKYHADNPFPYMNLGIIYENKKEYIIATEYYKKAISINPHANSLPYEGLCDYYTKTGDSILYRYYFTLKKKYFK